MHGGGHARLRHLCRQQILQVLLRLASCLRAGLVCAFQTRRIFFASRAGGRLTPAFLRLAGFAPERGGLCGVATPACLRLAGFAPERGSLCGGATPACLRLAGFAPERGGLCGGATPPFLRLVRLTLEGGGARFTPAFPRPAGFAPPRRIGRFFCRVGHGLLEQVGVFLQCRIVTLRPPGTSALGTRRRTVSAGRGY